MIKQKRGVVFNYLKQISKEKNNKFRSKMDFNEGRFYFEYEIKAIE